MPLGSYIFEDKGKGNLIIACNGKWAGKHFTRRRYCLTSIKDLFTFAAMSQSKQWFKDWFNSPYYYKLYFKHDDAEAAKFINNLLNYLKPGPDALMLDVACGRGRHSRQLAAKGFNVTGIDLSIDNIKEAKNFETDMLQFFVHDMRLPFWINYFDYAFNFYTSFGYFNTKREHNNSLRTIAQSIKPNGFFVLDYLNIKYIEDNFINACDVVVGDINFHITKWFDKDHFYKKIAIDDKAAAGPITYQEKVSKFSLNDFKQMLALQKMEIQDVYGNYDFDEYDEKKSPRMIIISKKIM